jgi:hypothetical protein
MKRISRGTFYWYNLKVDYIKANNAQEDNESFLYAEIVFEVEVLK